MPLRVIDVQATPNPNAVKFVLDRTAFAQPISFFDAASAKDHPLAQRLFEIDGVTSVLLLGDFLTVNKSPNVKWSHVKPKVQKVLETAL